MQGVVSEVMEDLSHCCWWEFYRIRWYQFGGNRARKSTMRHREVTHRGGCPGNRRAVDAHPQTFHCLLNL